MGEAFDVLDDKGNKTGEVKERKLVHQDGADLSRLLQLLRLVVFAVDDAPTLCKLQDFLSCRCRSDQLLRGNSHASCPCLHDDSLTKKLVPLSGGLCITHNIAHAPLVFGTT
jgi:hypothetical protein